MKHDKLLKIYQTLSLEDKERLMNILLDDSYLFLHSEKRGMGFDIEDMSENVFVCINGTQLQINIEMDKMYLCSIDTKKIKLNEKSWDKVKPNSFQVPLEKQVTRKELN
jgi:hypothetical protein